MSHNTIKIHQNGPLQVSGDIEVVDQHDLPLKDTQDGDLWLCRCGHSKQKPFCDGSHRDAGFRDDE